MRLVSVILAGAVGLAQSTTTQYTTDINGHRVETSSSTSSDGLRTERSRSLNGRDVPLEQIEEHVVSESPDGKVTERIVRKYDPTGQPQATEKVILQEQKRADGSSTVQATTYRSDLNGHMQEAERSTTESRKQGDSTITETAISRPTINGSFETTEKRSVTTQTSGDLTQENETVYRRSGSGDFYPALREVKELRKAGEKTTENMAFYEPDMTGQLALARQTASTTTKNPDGSEVTEVNLYARAADGVVQDDRAPQQIKEQQIISREKGPGGEVIERLSVRRPTTADPKRLGALQEISETICKGKCDSATPPAQPPTGPGNSRP
jgi:hypothetical protein